MLKVQTTYGNYRVQYLTGELIRAKTLVCLHGFMGAKETFDFLEKQKEFNVITIDLMGHGQSDISTNSDDYTLDHMAHALEQIFEFLDLEEFYLLGYSFGGRLALTYAYHYPNRLKHLFLESASMGLKTEVEKQTRRDADKKLAKKILKVGMNSFVDDWQELPLFATQKYLNKEVLQKEISQKKRQVPEAMSKSLEFGTVANQINFLETDLFEKVPVTYIAGKLDQKFTKIGEMLALEKKVDLIIVENVGHCVHLEAPDFFTDILYAVIYQQIVEVKHISAYEFELDLVTPFKTSYGELTKKKTDIFIVETRKGTVGYGELLSFEAPDYIEETIESDRLIIKNYLVPLLKNKKIYSPRQIRDIFKSVKGNQMAKAALETAIWDIFAKNKHMSLTAYLGLQREMIDVGVSIGLQKSEKELLAIIQEYVDEGYTRVKLKIKKGQDLSLIKAVRAQFPDLILMVDANSAYHLSDLDHLKQFDAFNLTMIEQPFASTDFYEHSILQKELKTSICLDENIRSLSDVKLAHKLASCRNINLKIPRVGGITEALDILDYAKENELAIWLGGMLESGVGRSFNVSLATHSAFTFPGDLSASNRYYKKDVIEEEFKLNNGKMISLEGFGIGIRLKTVKNEQQRIHYMQD